MFRLLVSDIDGTLVDSSQQVLPENLRAIRRLAAEGVKFTLATGRIEEAVRPFLRSLPVTVPLILYNGAKLVDHRTLAPLYEAFVEPEVVRLSLEAVSGLPLTAHLYREGRCYVARENPVSRRYAAKDRVKLWPVGDLTLLGGQAVNKLLLIADDEEDAEAAFEAHAERLGPRVRQRAHLVRSEPTYLEVLPFGATKGAALLRLLDTLKIPPGEVVAVGDSLNDLELLEVAGLGVAVADAHPRVLARADYISVRCAEGAIADVAGRFLTKAG